MEIPGMLFAPCFGPSLTCYIDDCIFAGPCYTASKEKKGRRKLTSHRISGERWVLRFQCLANTSYIYLVDDTEEISRRDSFIPFSLSSFEENQAEVEAEFVWSSPYPPVANQKFAAYYVFNGRLTGVFRTWLALFFSGPVKSNWSGIRRYIKWIDFPATATRVTPHPWRRHLSLGTCSCEMDYRANWKPWEHSNLVSSSKLSMTSCCPTTTDCNTNGCISTHFSTHSAFTRWAGPFLSKIGIRPQLLSAAACADLSLIVDYTSTTVNCSGCVWSWLTGRYIIPSYCTTLDPSQPSYLILEWSFRFLTS